MDKLVTEARILDLLSSGPMKQVDIVDAFPMELYMDVGRVLCDMDRREIVSREKSEAQKW